MYSNKFIACVKAKGKVLREKGETVLLPFGSEYTLWFKNENNRKVQIDVSIDGTDVLYGRSLLLGAGESMDLKGFVRDMDGDDNRAFKFITKTKQISDFRGDKIEDGLIKITYRFEREKPPEPIYRNVYTNHIHNDFYTKWYDTYPNGYPQTKGSGDVTYGAFNVNSSVSNDDGIRATSAVPTSFENAVPKGIMRGIGSVESSDPGITVEGSATNQSFQKGSIGILESTTHSIIFQLRGLDANTIIEEPITVKTKKQCTTCGKFWTGNFEYCPNDGTYLRFV